MTDEEEANVMQSMYQITKRFNQKCWDCHNADDWEWFNNMARKLNPDKLGIDQLVSLYSCSRWAMKNFDFEYLANKILINWIARDVEDELSDWIRDDLQDIKNAKLSDISEV
jgi:hypothetical protein